METEQIREKIVHLNSKAEKNQVIKFLKQQNLKFDKDIEYTVALFDPQKMIGTGSFSGKILKCIAIAPEYKSLGLANKIITLLLQEEFRRGNIHLFLYTKPENKRLFSELGFYKISEVNSRIVLMENKAAGIKDYLAEIDQYKRDAGIVSTIVMNCNPFTLGHQYLVEYAASRSDQLHIFIVWEDKSIFPPELRYQLVKEGVKHLSNVIVHKGRDYIISAATFPSYFIETYQEVVETQAALDLKIFSDHIIPALGISKRFVGEEPFCPVTRTYNKIMKKILPEKGVEVVEVSRLSIGRDIVSASKVREYIGQGEFLKVKKLVPETTYNFLISENAKDIIQQLQSGY